MDYTGDLVFEVSFMKELIEHIARSLVTMPEAVEVVETVKDNKTVNLELHTAKEDMGKVIGKQGRIAKAMRTVLKAAANTEGKKANLDIV